MDAVSRLAQIDDLDELARLVEERCVYARVSRGPDADRAESSRDYESGLDLPGLSVTPLVPESWWHRPVQDWLARQLCAYEHLREDAEDDRRVWVLEGEVVARGPDNEPLVQHVRPLAWVSPDCISEAKRRYRERFDVGRDSTSSRESADSTSSRESADSTSSRA